MLSSILSGIGSSREWVRRHRRTVLVASAGGAAVLGYYAYQRLKPLVGEMQEGLAMIRNMEEQMNEEEERSKRMRLQRGFTLNMDAARMTVLTMSTEIRNKASQIFDVDSLRKNLRKGKREAGDYDLLEEFKISVIARSFLSYYVMCMVDALVKVQLSIIGRHSYTPDNAVLQSEDVENTETSKKRFLELAQYIISDGMFQIATIVKANVQKSTRSWEMQAPISSEQFQDMVKELRTQLDEELVKHCRTYTISPKATLSVHPGATSELFVEMVSETCNVLQSASFSRVLKQSLDEVFASLDPLSEAFVNEGTVRFGRLLPKITKIFESTLPRTVDDGERSEILRLLHEQQELCALCKVIYFPVDVNPVESSPGAEASAC